MNDLRTLQHDPFHTPFDRPDELSGREDWEDWDDDAPSSPTETPGEEPLVALGSQTAARPSTKASDRSQYRNSVQKPARLKSRLRQKAQNEMAGIKVVTDMSKFEKRRHIAQQMRSAGPDRRTGKFVNAAALRALEGSPNESSVGNWHWLKRRQANNRSTKSPQNQHGRKGSDLSPDDRPIVIGIAMPEDDLAEKAISPQSATLDSPPTSLRYPFKKKAGPNPSTPSEQPRSFWSPDTPEGGSPYAQRSRAVSSAYSQANVSVGGDAPPVPGVPFHHKQHPRVASVELDDDDNFSPVTLFEEDGSPSTRAPFKKKGHSRSPTTVGAQSGWWDHVQTPFVEQQSNNPFASKPKSPEDEQPEQKGEWWKGVDEKKAVSPKRTAPGLGIATISTPSTSRPSPTVASSSRSPPPTQPESLSDKARILAEENQIPNEEPPPYEATSKHPIKYRAVFPPGHPLRNQFPPSPGPVSPALAGTMTSQGAIGLTDVPLTPASRRPELGEGGSTLPDRPHGGYAAADHFGNAAGSSPAAKIERQRRRHEKEDAMARRVEGFWKGRGCIPENGCYGRRGREGRQRRRIWCIFIAALLIAIILAVALAVTLAHRTSTTVLTDTPFSTFLNISGFPPIPTGVNTVVGPDARSVDGCVQPSTLWTCSLPKEQQQSNKPYQPDQPEFVFQIQYDSNPRQLWKVPDGSIPTPTVAASSTSSISSSSSCVAVKPTGSPDSAIPVNCGVALMSQLSNQTSPNNTVGGKGDELGKGGRSRRAERAGGPAFWGRVRSLLSREDGSTQSYDTGFNPKPDPPPFHEYWFLGNTTDGIVSSRKAGEPTPFYITFLPSLNSTPAGPNIVQKKRGVGNGISVGPDGNFSSLLPPPALNPDGTGAPAVLRPHPFQQPLRLFDRGLATEHYGFYSYFDKTMYVRSINSTEASDEDGGSLEKEAGFVVTYTQLRFHVQIWTRTSGSAKLLSDGSGTTANNSTRPGSFPYPVTISEDMHGGDFNQKATFARKVDGRQKILLDDPKLVTAMMNFGGKLINHAADPSFGGVDGGTGGCKCSWTNFLGVNGKTVGSGS